MSLQKNVKKYFFLEDVHFKSNVFLENKYFEKIACSKRVDFKIYD